MRRALLTAGGGGVTLPAIGASFMGGYYAGTIDTTRAGSITAADAYQTGARYALIVAPASLESASVAWRSPQGVPVAGAKTRWNGLSSTAAMAAVAGTYPAASYCAGLTYPSDAASSWYLPALDELELAYRNLKPTTGSNSTATVSADFPTSQKAGTNPSSDPTGAAYTSTVPAQTAASAFQSGGTEALATGAGNEYWAATYFFNSLGGGAWAQQFANGAQNGITENTARHVRPVRRLLL